MRIIFPFKFLKQLLPFFLLLQISRKYFCLTSLPSSPLKSMEVAEFVVNAIHGTNANDYSLYQYDEQVLCDEILYTSSKYVYIIMEVTCHMDSILQKDVASSFPFLSSPCKIVVACSLRSFVNVSIITKCYEAIQAPQFFKDVRRYIIKYLENERYIC